MHAAVKAVGPRPTDPHDNLAVVAEGLTKTFPAGKRKTFTAVDHVTL
jgi:hypothetical protein